jgi:hypothetical protein
LFLQCLALVQQVADVLRNAAQLLAELVFVDARQLVQEALILLQIGLRLSHLTLKIPDRLPGLQGIPVGQ